MNKNYIDAISISMNTRKISLWIEDAPDYLITHPNASSFLSLPWQSIMLQGYDKKIISIFEKISETKDELLPARGPVILLDNDPEKVGVPQNYLPVYLLYAYKTDTKDHDFDEALRRMTLLQAFRSKSPGEIIFIGSDIDSFFNEISPIIKSLQPSILHIVSPSDRSPSSLIDPQGLDFHKTHIGIIDEITESYGKSLSSRQLILKVRDEDGILKRVDLTEYDNPNSPITMQYDLLTEYDIQPLAIEDLTEEDVTNFFSDPSFAWRPYAAGVPWQNREIVDLCVRKKKGSKLESLAQSPPKIYTILSQAGAGTTTTIRMLAMEMARLGFPTLVAKKGLTEYDAHKITNFVTTAKKVIYSQKHDGETIVSTKNILSPETPWCLFFDSEHWEGKELELIRFFRELRQSGRDIIIFSGINPAQDQEFARSSSVVKLFSVEHIMSEEETTSLGKHINRYLAIFNKERSEQEWHSFYTKHTLEHLSGASFWITLSFWIQRQYDMSKTVQQWMFEHFINIGDVKIQKIIIKIAALSSCRTLTPLEVIPSDGAIPVSHQLGEYSRSAPGLCLSYVKVDGNIFWGLLHDILGEFLVNAAYYDKPLLESLGYADASSPKHLKLIILKDIATDNRLTQKSLQNFAEDFARKILKIDQEKGLIEFMPMWSFVLQIIHEMPALLKSTSRTFIHHSAITKRRIAHLDEGIYNIDKDYKYALLQEAAEDISTALKIPQTGDADSDLNLYNSLSNVYIDLARFAGDNNKQDDVLLWRQRANEASRQAYLQNPTSSFVIETFIKNLLLDAKESPANAISSCLEALEIIFSTMSSQHTVYRARHLGKLAEQALSLINVSEIDISTQEPDNPLALMMQAWLNLTKDQRPARWNDYTDIPLESCNAALATLQTPYSPYNILLEKFKYNLTSISEPYNFIDQYKILDGISINEPLSPQLALNYAILLFLNGKYYDGDLAFRALRRMWRENDFFVFVPSNLLWLRRQDGAVQLVNALTTTADRLPLVQIPSMGNVKIPFRPEEFNFKKIQSRQTVLGAVTFGHNGPFLRPSEAAPGGTHAN